MTKERKAEKDLPTFDDVLGILSEENCGGNDATPDPCVQNDATPDGTPLYYHTSWANVSISPGPGPVIQNRVGCNCKEEIDRLNATIAALQRDLEEARGIIEPFAIDPHHADELTYDNFADACAWLAEHNEQPVQKEDS